MLEGLPQRRRLTILTGVLVAALLLLITLTVLISSRPEPGYLPGEKMAGLTSDLDRNLPPDYPRIRFIDAASEAGINFRHFHGMRSTQLPEDMGSGAAWADYDNDGWLDLFVVNQAGPLTLTPDAVRNSPAHCALYHNKGDGSFTEVSADAGVDYRGWGMAAAWGDYDNDGWPDLFITTYGESILFRNGGDGTFRNMTAAAGLLLEPGFWAGAAWTDYNRDGFLDLYVCGYVRYTASKVQSSSMQYDTEVPASINPSSYPPERNLLYLNDGHGHFSEVAEAAGVADSTGRSLSAAWCDFDGDGWPDLYIANDVSDNVFFLNQGDGTFVEKSNDAWVSDYRGAMGLAVGDWDGDSDLDLFVTHWIAQENALYSNLISQMTAVEPSASGVKFVDEADRYGLGQVALDYIGWGTSFFDYDNDGRPDLFVANGSTFQRKEDPTRLQPMKPKLFWNKGREAGFYDVSAVSGDVLSKRYVGRGAAFADYDNDGDVDIFVVQQGGPAHLFRNEGGNTSNWLEVQAKGRRSNASAIGTTLRVVTGASVQIQQIGSQSSYCSQNSLRTHFGLGNVSKVDTLEIAWPSGTRQRFTDVQVNQIMRVVEGQDIQPLKPGPRPNR